ncbi:MULTISPECIES: APC family permease [unclassified Streptomyces]|uniref:APC family permease n=1 Tax=unclassified Streptomyces TaxID=2593676 RepID=UPI00093EB42A|nr:APC family permease [Streptomyces sp. TSRI0107]OKJ74598.1 amino acid transporter [Streptomyces sp. TSRI0107]
MADTSTTPPPVELRKSLGIIDGIALAASSTAATTSIGIGLGALASITGRQTPVILLLAFLPMLGIVGAYARLNKSEPNCGTAYAWVGRTLGPWLGMIAGWVPLAAGVVFLAYTTSVTGSVLIQCAHKAGLDSLFGRQLDANSTLQCTLVGLFVLAAVTITAVTGVQKATRFQTWLLVFEYVVLLVFCCWGLVAGDQPFSFSWFDPLAVDSVSGLAQGLVLAVFFYWGWDAAFSVTEETENTGDAARGSHIALFTMLGLFLLGAAAFQRVMTEPEMSGTGAEGLTYFASRLADEPLATLPLIALMFSAVASLQAGIIPTARLTLAMSRERTLGPVWSRVSERHGGPTAGTVLITLISAVIAVLMLVIPKLNEAILAAVNAIGLLVALYYGLVALACAARFRGTVRSFRTDPRQAVGAVLVPAVCGLLLLALGAYLAFYYATLSNTFAVSVDNGWFNLLCPAVMVVIGLIVSAVAKWHRRAPYFTPQAPAPTAAEPEAQPLP